MLWFKRVLFVVFLSSTIAIKACKIDLVLVVDRSGSIGKDPPFGDPENWNQVISFLVNLIENLRIGKDATQVGLVAFSERAELYFNLTAYGENDKDELIHRVRLLPYNFKTGGRTNTKAGMDLTAELFAFGNGERREAPNVVILLTDGNPTAVLNTHLNDSVNFLKNERAARIIGVGITKEVGNSLSYIVSDQRQDIYQVDDFFGLQGRVKTITEEACKTVGDNEQEKEGIGEGGVAFSAHIKNVETIHLKEGMTVPFDSTFSNTGGHYNANNNSFICPRTGMYRFTHTMSGVTVEVGTAIVKNNTIASPLAYTRPGLGTSVAMFTDTIIKFLKGERVYVQVMVLPIDSFVSGTYRGGALFGFTGQLLYDLR